MPVDVRKFMSGERARKGVEDAPTPPKAVFRSSGIDYAELSRQRYERASPEERARIDAWEARQAELAAVREHIPATFERVEWKEGTARPRTESHVVRTWEKPVGIVIDTVGQGPDAREVVRFEGAVTGHEAYTLDEGFCRLLTDPSEREARPRLYICGGTPGRWDGCSVDPDDVVDYLRRVRPALFPDVTTAPTP